MSYDYHEAIKDDCVEAIKEYLEYHKDEVRGISKDSLRQKFHDSFWTNDSVTGNGSGSYTFSSYDAEQNIAGNWDLLGEAMGEFCCKADAVEKGPEWADVTIRCYLLGEGIDKAMRELEEMIDAALEEIEEEDEDEADEESAS